MSKYCQNCGEPIAEGTVICPKCGVQVKALTVKHDEKNPILAAILSFIFPGLGQAYNGEMFKAVCYAAAAICFAITIVILIGLILYPLFMLWSIYEAYTTAQKINAKADLPGAMV